MIKRNSIEPVADGSRLTKTASRNRISKKQTTSIQAIMKQATKEDDDTDSEHKLGRNATSPDPYDIRHIAAMVTNLEQYDFPFENIVFEGGGAKGLAYVGAIQMLEEVGVMKNIKRFAGSSIGSMLAAATAMGCTSEDIDVLIEDLKNNYLDNSCGYCGLIPNILRRYGWKSGNKFYNWLGRLYERLTGDANITFSQLYKRYDKELCVIVTNLNMKTEEYFHPKTTPDVPIRLAVRMSASMPGLYQPVEWIMHGKKNFYIDGGLLCNFPVHCFDGWWLSMKMEDSFLNKLHPLDDSRRLLEQKERFGEYNDKTLGLLLYANGETDLMVEKLQQRLGGDPDCPNTILARKRRRNKKTQDTMKTEHARIVKAFNAFTNVLKKQNTDGGECISKEALQQSLNDTTEFPKRYAERLFGKDVSVDDVMEALDDNGDGNIEYSELITYMERIGVSIQSHYVSYQRSDIKSLGSFVEALFTSFTTNIMRVFITERDFDRTVGIHTGHVDSGDFNLPPKDRAFVINQGRISTEAYLQHYVVKFNPPKKQVVNNISHKLNNGECQQQQKNSNSRGHVQTLTAIR